MSDPRDVRPGWASVCGEDGFWRPVLTTASASTYSMPEAWFATRAECDRFILVELLRPPTDWVDTGRGQGYEIPRRRD